MNIQYNNGRDPLGLCLYLLDPNKQRHKNDNPIISTNMAGRNAVEFAEEFRFNHDTNPIVTLSMRHFSVSFQPGETLSRDTFAAIFQRIYQLTGHHHCLFVNAKHYDKEDMSGVEHGHGAVSAIDKDGNWVDDAHILIRLKYGLGQEKSVQQHIEEEFNLRPHPFRPERERNNLPTGEYRMKQRLGLQQTTTEKLWQLIQQATDDQPTLAVMAARLITQGVGVNFKAVDDAIAGISFEIDGTLRKGQDLGRQYSFNGLQRHGFVQLYSGEMEQLLQIQNFSAQQCHQFLNSHPSQQHIQQQLEHDRLHQHYVVHRQQPKRGSKQWQQAISMLQYLEIRMNDIQATELHDQHLQALWHENTQQMALIAHENPPRLILHGEAHGTHDWNILHADISHQDWLSFQNNFAETTLHGKTAHSHGFDLD